MLPALISEVDSAAAMRHVGSALSDPYTCVAAAISALYGPLHGGANEAVLRMLERIKSKANVLKNGVRPAFKRMATV